jgi:formate dehydrogenase maturation protein FdhE
MAEYPKAMLERMAAELLGQRTERALENNRSVLRNCRSTYKIEPEQVLEMLRQQDVNCGICQATFEDRRWVVDHCHKTQVVRGLICNTCNTWLGTFELRVIGAAKYLGMKW